MWGIYDSRPLLWNNSIMKVALLLAVVSMPIPAPALAQVARQRPAVPAPAAVDKVAEAYEQFLLAHRLEQQSDIEGAVAAYKRATDLDPSAADIPAELASLYLRQNRTQDAMNAAQQSLAIESDNREANRVLGTVYAAMADAGREANTTGRNLQAINDNITKAIHHLEIAIDRPVGQPNSNVLATLGSRYVGAGAFDKAIPILTHLVARETDWQEGTTLLLNAYIGDGRNRDAIA